VHGVCARARTHVRACIYIYIFSFSDDSSYELGSPIHKTEEKFSAEEDNVSHKSVKKGARLDRLAALASTINNWEDDLSHPTLNSAKVCFYNIY
jgi:hypothetical protein